MTPAETKSLKTMGTRLQGYVTVPYDRIEKVFGPPTQTYEEEDRKMNMRWVIEFRDGKVATLYDCYEFTTADGLKKRKSVRWHIGGFDHQVVQLISEKLRAVGVVFP